MPPITYPNSFYDQRLSNFGFKLNDLITFDNKRNTGSQTGGIIYKIISDTPPQRAVIPRRRITTTPTKKYRRYMKIIPAKNAEGKNISQSESVGCIRCVPVFEFFATSRGKKPGGIGKTMIITYSNLKHMKKIDIVEIGTKYVELGNFLKDIAKSNGMTSNE